jgi:phage terminase large subunit-like protein
MEIAPTEAERLVLEYTWSFWARTNQIPPPGDWFTWLILSGRGFGKTRIGAEWVIERAKHGPFFPIALVGQTKADVRDTMIEVGESSILKVSPPWFRPEYEPSKRRLTWPNGMIATVFSGDEPDQLRGPQHGSAWVDELAKFQYPVESFDNLVLGLRLGDQPQGVVTTTPRPIPIIKTLSADETTSVTVGSTFENIANLSPIFIREVLKRYQGTRLGEQELYGKIMTDTPGALWTRDVLEATRVKKAPDLVRIVVSVDPGASTGEGANHTGIVAAGIDAARHGYVLADASCKKKPAGWGESVVRLYDSLNADCVVAEVNQGGDMVGHVVQSAAKDLHSRGERRTPEIAFKAVRATKGKYTRAEPISALYEQKRVHHVGLLPELEDEQCTWVPGEDSPDRLDAVVWGLSELMLGAKGDSMVIENPVW